MKLNKICSLFLVSIFMVSFVACSPNASKNSDTESVITKYVNTYYTVAKEDVELYKSVAGGNKDVSELVSDTNKANEKFKDLMTDAAYEDLLSSRMAYGRCKQASEGNYYVTVKSIKIEKDSTDAGKETYYYDIELLQTPTSGGEAKTIKERKQITLSKVKDNWKISNSFTHGY